MFYITLLNGLSVVVASNVLYTAKKQNM